MFTATVPYFVPDGETITFYNGATQIGSVALHSGKAILTTKTLPVGSDSLTAQYGGDTNYSGSTSITVTETVN